MEEVSVMSDDYLADRKPFCLRGYLAAWRGDDVSEGGGGAEKPFTLTVYNCGQFPVDAPTAKFRLIQCDI